MRKILLAGLATVLFTSVASHAEQIFFPEEFIPLQVGERVIEHSFFSRVDQLELAPGTYQLKLKYDDLYELGYDSHEVIESEPFWVELTVNEGKDYDLVFDRASNVVAARIYAESPVVSLKARGAELTVPLTKVASYTATQPAVSANTKPAIATAAVTAPKAVASQPVAATTLPAKVPGGREALQQGPSAAAMLEFWWQQATEQERQAFLEKVQK